MDKYDYSTYATHIAEHREAEAMGKWDKIASKSELYDTCLVCKKEIPEEFMLSRVCDRCTDHGR